MNWVLALAFLAFATGQAHSAPSKKASTAKTPKGRAAHGTPAHAAKTSGTRRRLLHIVPAPSYQLRPDPERYQEIQQALSDKGYFKGAVSGSWDGDSVDALKRFQADQKLPDDGKINALTLTGLGLGPKHNESAAAPPTASEKTP